MKLSQIEQVLEVAKVGSISQAAINLYISQPNLSRSIRMLEEEIGNEIFERSSKGIKLTRFGKIYVDYATNISNQMNHLKDICTSQKSVVPLILEVGTVGYLFISSILSSIYIKYKEHPINIVYLESSTVDIIESISQGQLGIGVISVWNYTKGALMLQLTEKKIEFHSMGNVSPGIYIHKTNKQIPTGIKSVDASVLGDLPLVDYYPNDYFYTSDLLENYEIHKRRRRISIDNRGTMIEMLRKTEGFAFATFCEKAYQKIDFTNELRFIPFKDTSITCEVGWLQKCNTSRTILMSEFVQELSNLFL